MPSEATYDKAVLEHLVTSTTTQYAAIKALLQEIKIQRGSKNSGRNPCSDHIPDGNEMRKLKKAQHKAAACHIKRIGEGRILLEPRPRRPLCPQQPHLYRPKTRASGNGCRG